MGIFVFPVICMLYEEFCVFHDEALDGRGGVEQKGYEIIKSTPSEVIECHGGWEGGEPLVKVYYFNPISLC